MKLNVLYSDESAIEFLNFYLLCYLVIDGKL